MSVASLQAELDIARLLHSYAAAVDGRQFQAIGACYWEDGFEDHAPGYCGPVTGYLEWLREIMAPGPVLTHLMANIVIDLADHEDSAAVTSYCISTATFPGPQGTPSGWLQQGLHYADEVTRRQGQWRFQRRRCRQVWAIENGTAQAVTPAS